jgi:hypothetical protein
MRAEVFDSVEKTMEYYGGDKHPLADFHFNFHLTTNIGKESSPHDIRNTIEQWMSNLPDSKWANWVVSFCIRARAHERLEPQRFFHRWNERSVLNASEPTDGCFTAAFFQTQHASFSVRCGGRTAVGGGNGTRKNIPA